MECYICKALEEKGEYRLDGSWTSLEIIKENDGYYCNALGDGKASIPINFCPNCGCQLDDYKALKVLRLDDLDVEKETTLPIDFNTKTARHATFGLDTGKRKDEQVECLYPSIPSYKDDSEELNKVVERRINSIKERLRCAVCNGVGLTSMGAGIRGMVTCQACHGTGLMNEPITHTIKKYQEDIKELEEYVEYWQKECDRRQAKIDKALEDIDKLIAGTYMKTNGEATYGYYQSGCCTQRLNIIRDDLKGEENCNDNNWMSRYWKGEEDGRED